MITTVYVLLVVTWLMYIQVMASLRVWNSLHWVVKIHLLPIGAVFLLLDVAINVTLATVIFMERPKWWTLSERLHHHAINRHGWKTTLSRWICRNILNPFDINSNHCGNKGE